MASSGTPTRSNLGRFLLKDVRLQLRDLQELALLLLMPIILIGILGLALGQFLTGGPLQLSIDAALVVDDDPAEGRAEFMSRLAEANMPVPQRLALTAAAVAVQPVEMLRSTLLSPELGEFMTVRQLQADEAADLLGADKVQAVITLPQGYTANTLAGMLLAESGSTIAIDLSDASPLRAGIVRDVVSSFAHEVSFQSALSQVLQGPPPAAPADAGGIETVTVGSQLSSVAFYTLGMAVMFALFVAGSISSRAFLERSDLTFDRILLSGARPLEYLLSKTLAGALVTFLQLAFLFAAATLALGAFRGQPASFWLTAAGVGAALATCIGALGALVTSLNFRANNRSLSNVFNSVLVMGFAVLGGSFFPSDNPDSLIARIGGWTPNGAALNGFMDAAKGLGTHAYLPDITRLLLIAVILLAAALLAFPRTAER